MFLASDIHKYASDGTVSALYQGEVGKLYGARFVQSTNLKSGINLSAGVSGVREYMFAPDAYYVTEIGDMTAKTYVKQLGSGGTNDPVNMIATVGAKVFFGVIPVTYSLSTTEYHMARLIHSTTMRTT